jgi:hypothetical protein
MIRWYAGSTDVVRMGPFETQVEAWRALRAVKSKIHLSDTVEAGMRTLEWNRLVHVPGAYVWCEEESC